MRAIFMVMGLASCHIAPTGQNSAPPALDEEVVGDLQRYVRALGSKNASVCLDAVDYLPYFGNAAAPALIAALASSDPNQRGFAAATLGRIADARAVPRLIGLLEDKAPMALYVLSDDGEERHPAYDNDAYNVAQQAQLALVAIVGKRLSKKTDWETWWADEGATFKPYAREPVAESLAMPLHAVWLKGVKICVDPGHGGDMQKRGYKRGPTYMSEAEINLRVGRFLREFLERAGATVVMTRNSDRDVDLKARAELAGTSGCDLFLSVHHNWSPRLDAQATTTWYHSTPDVKPASVDMARYVEEETIKQVAPADLPRGGGLMADTLIYESGFAVLRQLPADVAGCLVETTYYSNLAMERRLRDIEFNRREAYGIFLGLAKYMYYGVPRAEVVRAGADGVVLQVYDGLEGRREWAKPYRILSEFIRVKLDGVVVAHTVDVEKGCIEVKGVLGTGEHSIGVDLINIHKNHSWPRALKFSIK